jgi:hypothetical protein
MLLLAAQPAFAADSPVKIVPTIVEGKLGARVEAIAFPPTLSKELTSGLTNRLFARVSVMDAGTVIEQRAVEIALRYDLWDEEFSIASTLDGTIVDTRHHASVADVDALLRALPLPKLFETTAFRPDRELVLRVEVLLNPITREKMRTIRRWVARNSSLETGEASGMVTSNAIFNRIFDQYSSASDVAAVWRVDVSSPPFRPSNVANEGR